MERVPAGGRRHVAAVAAVALFAVSACENAAGEQRSDSESAAADRMSSDFAEQGHEELADRIADEDATELTQREAPYLQDWEVFEVSTDHDEVHPPTQTLVATSEHGSELLTGNPDGFATMLDVDSAEIDDAETAIQVAEDYVLWTASREDDVETSVLESPDDIEVWSGYEDERAEVAAEFGDEIAPPEVDHGNDTYVATVYVQHGFEVQRQTVTMTPEGALDDEPEVLVTDVHDP